MKNSPQHRRAKNEGFAVIIALSLMSFVLLLLLTVSTLSRVEVQVSRSALQDLKARQSALLGLQIAVGELQALTGPDQRVTATANIAAGPDGSRIVAGASPENNSSLDGTEKGLSPVVPGTRYWTGVFKNRDEPEDIYQKTPSVSLQRWLVSGQNAPTPPTPADSSFSVGADGELTDSTKAILLAGPHSVGEGSDAEDRYVAAPRVLVSGLSTGNAPSSAFAYWVGDEGVKARINMEQVDVDSDYASLIAQRRAWETVDEFADYPLPGDDKKLTKVFNLPELEFFMPALLQGTPSTPLESIFHAATTYSQGLLVNTLDGGTQVDLTALLSGALPSSAPADSYDNYPRSGSAGRVIPTSAFPELQHLTWEHVRDFYQTGTNASSRLQVQAAGTATNTIAPTITDFRLLLGARLSDAVFTTGDDFDAFVHLAGKIAVTIANPYSEPLEWGEPIELEIMNNTPAAYPEVLEVSWRYVSGNAGFTGARYLPSADSDANRNGNEPALLNQAVFQIQPGRLEPGEARAYSHTRRTSRSWNDADSPIIVELGAVDPGTIRDFNKNLEAVLGKLTFPRGMQLRGWDPPVLSLTSRIMIDMRLGGTGKLLRRIEGFEINNPFRAETTRWFGKDEVFDDGIQVLTGAIPLQLYKFQISQPGTNYLLSSISAMGQLASTLRTYADFNLRATHYHSPIASYNPPPFFMELLNDLSLLPFDWPGGDTGSAFSKDLVFSPLNWGYSQAEGSTQTVLYSFPEQFVSLAQFQHADLTQDAVTRSIAHQPGNAFGNSYATPFVQRNLTRQVRVDYDLGATTEQASRGYYDISHLLNSAIWDRYFFSSIPTGGVLPENSGMVPLPGVTPTTLTDPDTAAPGLIVDGAFNVNSVEKEAWKAFLGSSKYFRHPADSGSEVAAAFPRSLEQLVDYQADPSGKDDDSYAGYRRLSDEQLDALAEAMVRQARLRGPFISRSHFVNRALADIASESELSRSGALQAAIDESGININLQGDLNRFSALDANFDQVTLQVKGGAPRADMDGGFTNDQPSNAPGGVVDWAVTSLAGNYSTVASIVADRETLVGAGSADLVREQGYRSTGIPGWVTQADVLQVIGPAISARSDTFRIRTAGQSLDLSGKVKGTAYLEAVVQRMPEYVDTSNAANVRDTASTTNLTLTNQQYGRKFEIISVRWLSPDEI